MVRRKSSPVKRRNAGRPVLSRGGSLLLSLLPGPLGSLMVADDTACDHADLAVAGHVADDTADDGALDAAFGLDRCRCRDRPHQDEGEQG